MDQSQPHNPRLCPQCGTATLPEAAVANLYCCGQCGTELAHVDTTPMGGVRGVFGWLKQDGDVVGERYLIRAVLGKGGFGATYLAEDRRVRGKRWALKEIPQLLFDEHEVALLGKLDHPSIPAIADCFAENGMQYLVLKFGGNRTLRHECLAHGRIPYATLKPWAVQLAQVLHYLHGQTPPVVHRDLKPDNVLLDEYDRVMLIDFGIAKQALPDTKTRTSGRAISHGFSAPEQLLNTGTDARSDVYAYAATLYYALTGQTPLAAFERVTGGSLLPVDQWAPDVPAPVAAALQQAMSLNPNERQQHIGELLEVLDDGARSRDTRPGKIVATGNLAVPIGAPLYTDKTVLLPKEPFAPPRKPFAWRRSGLVLLGVVLVSGGGYLAFRAWQDTAKQPAETPAKDAAVQPGGVPEPEMVSIPGGSFLMGSSSGEEGSQDDERPRHPVTVAAFKLGKHEVTREQFAAFVDDSGYNSSGCYAWNGSTFEQDSSTSWRNPGFSQSGSHPVACVSWEDAQAYLRWLNGKTGKRYRLPTEAEWEYAARAGTSTARHWGEEANSACGYANVADRTAKSRFTNWSVFPCGDGYVFTAPVGSYQPNAFGLYDTLGNVWEWTCSDYTGRYDGTEMTCNSGASGLRVIRGGSWDDPPLDLRSASRTGPDPDFRSNDLGFRLAQD